MCISLLFLGNPPSAKAWAAQSGIYMAIMVVEKVLITFLIQLEFWDKVICPILVDKSKQTLMLID